MDYSVSTSADTERMAEVCAQAMLRAAHGHAFCFSIQIILRNKVHTSQKKEVEAGRPRADVSKQSGDEGQKSELELTEQTSYEFESSVLYYTRAAVAAMKSEQKIIQPAYPWLKAWHTSGNKGSLSRNVSTHNILETQYFCHGLSSWKHAMNNAPRVSETKREVLASV